MSEKERAAALREIIVKALDECDIDSLVTNKHVESLADVLMFALLDAGVARHPRHHNWEDVRKIHVLERILADRERELLELKGPCSTARCRSHFAHSGPCDIPYEKKTASRGFAPPRSSTDTDRSIWSTS